MILKLKHKQDKEGGGFGSNKFTFDRVFDMDSNQKEVYDIAAKPIIDSINNFHTFN